MEHLVLYIVIVIQAFVVLFTQLYYAKAIKEMDSHFREIFNNKLKILKEIDPVLAQCLHARECNYPYGQTEKFPSVDELKRTLDKVRGKK